MVLPVVLETGTLRVALGVVAVVLVVLFFQTFRRTRSSYSGWWCVALLQFLFGSLLFLFNGSAHQQWANPLGNTLLVLGSACVWAAARSLVRRRVGALRLLAAPAVTAVASLLDRRSDTWSGGLVFLALMALMVALASWELWQAEQEAAKERTLLVLASALFAAYYAGRCLVFALQGPQSPVFQTYFGSAVTTLMTLVLLVIVSFSMTALSNAQLISKLRSIAARDDLTKLLNRGAFMELAALELRKLQLTKSPAVLIMADLDGFKGINDNYGHLAGDQVLRSFGAACKDAVREGDAVGRFGGEEFVLFLPGASGSRAAEVVAQISADLARAYRETDLHPTASYGIAAADHALASPGLEELLEAADAALYEAKSRGRNQAVTAAGLSTPARPGPFD